MRVHEVEGGYIIHGDGTSEEVHDFVRALGPVGAVVTDPPYGNLIRQPWDNWKGDQRSFADWMLRWTAALQPLVMPGGAMYVWGGYGTPGFRPFFEYASRVEAETPWRVSNLLTWGKKRAYGVQNNYLACREDMLFMVNGDPKKPRTFSVPYLETKRGYAGYNPKYPAKSEFYRRTNVWTDVTEILSGKVHLTQKPLRVMEVPIEVSTMPGDFVLDPFAGSCTTAHAAMRSGRRFVCVEQDGQMVEQSISDLRDNNRKR